jgi:hypothetical protein
MLLRILDNTGDGVLSALPKGKQNEDLKKVSYSTERRDTKLATDLSLRI